MARCYNLDMTLEVISAPPDTGLLQAVALLDTLTTWRPTPTAVKALIERARDRLCGEQEIAARCKITPTHLGRLRGKDKTLADLYTQARDREEVAVLLLDYYSRRGAYRTIYDAVNGDNTIRRANVQAAQSVIELADRRRRAARGPNPMSEMME